MGENAGLPCVYVQFEHEDGARMAQAILGVSEIRFSLFCIHSIP